MLATSSDNFDRSRDFNRFRYCAILENRNWNSSIPILYNNKINSSQVFIVNQEQISHANDEFIAKFAKVLKSFESFVRGDKS